MITVSRKKSEERSFFIEMLLYAKAISGENVIGIEG
jgi:hypothetical protein